MPVLKTTRLTSSTRRCPRNCVCSMAWRSTKVYLTRSLMSTQDVVDNQGQWTHTYDGFPPIGNNNHALAFSAALVAAGKLGAPADDPLVAKLYQETVGVHLAALVASKDMPGLVHKVVNYGRQDKHEWTHGDLIVTKLDDARKLSAALQRRGLLEARAGDSRVQSTARKSKFHGRSRRPRAPNSLVDFHRSRKRSMRSSSGHSLPERSREV